jgi:ABC-type antimicrobial peptide transport system permease subunit
MTLSFWWSDAGRAVRFLGRHPLFALGVILVLAIGIGPVAALASLMNVAFLRPWQVPDPDRLSIFRARPAAGEAWEISIAEYRFLRDHSRLLSHIAARRLGAQPYIAVAALLTIVTIAACVVPARRAMNVDPVTALRAD